MSALLNEKEKIQQLIVVMNLVSGDSMPIDEWNVFVDAVEAQCVKYPQLDFKVEHTLLDGMYIRRIYMPEGAFVISRIHNFEHPFVILKGKVIERTHFGKRMYEAPYRGITGPGTRRILLMLEDTVWETYHPTDLNSVTEIANTIFGDRRNPLLSDDQISLLNTNCQKSNLLN